MKRIFALLFAFVCVLSLVVIPCSADGLNFQNFGIKDTYSAMCGSYSKGDYTTGKLIFPNTLSGVDYPNTSCDMEVTFRYRVYPDDHPFPSAFRDYMFRWETNFYHNNLGKILTYDEAKEWFTFGDITAQNGFTYDFIKFEALQYIDYTDHRIAFITSPYCKDLIYKYPEKAFYEIKFTLYFKDYAPNTPITYDLKPGESNALKDDIVAIDPSHCLYPEVHFNNLDATMVEWDPTLVGKEFPSYLQLDSCRIFPSQITLVRPLTDRTTFPTAVFYSNFLAPIHNNIYNNNDIRYAFRQRFNSEINVSLGQRGKDQIKGDIKGGLAINKPDQPFYSFYDYQSKVDTVYYYTALQTEDIATYEVNHFSMTFQTSLVDVNDVDFPIYYRISTLPRPNMRGVRDFNNYPLSFGGWMIYKPVSGLYDYIANGNQSLEGVNYGEFYVDIAPSGDNVLEKIGNIFTQTIPNIANNALIWLMCESPLISNVTRPLFLSAKKAGDIVTQMVLPVLTSAGLLGVIFVCTLLLNIIRRFIFK